MKRIFILALSLLLCMLLFSPSAAAVYYPGNDDQIYLTYYGQTLKVIPVAEPVMTWEDLYASLDPAEYAFGFTDDYVELSASGKVFRIYDASGQPVKPDSRVYGGSTYLLCTMESVSLYFWNESIDPALGFDFDIPDSHFALIQYAAFGFEFENEDIGSFQFVQLEGGKIAVDLDSPYSSYSGLYYLKNSYGDYALLNDAASYIEFGPIYYLVRICGGSHENSSWHTIVSATCVNAGEEHYICDDCQKILDVRAIPLGGHDLDLLGNCRNCNYSSVGDALSGVGGFFGGLWDKGKDFLQGVIDGGQDIIDGGKEEIETTVDRFVVIFAVTAGLAIAVPLAILIVRVSRKFKKKK